MGYLRACDERDFDKEFDREAPGLVAEGAFVTTRHSSKRNRKLPELAEECCIQTRLLLRSQPRQQPFLLLSVSQISASASLRVCLGSLAPRFLTFPSECANMQGTSDTEKGLLTGL